MKTWRTWTRKEDQRLEELRMQGLSAPKIAKEMGRTEPSVKCRISQLQAERFSPRQQKWIELLMIPHNLRDVAAKMGVDYRSVVRARYRLKKAKVEISDEFI